MSTIKLTLDKELVEDVQKCYNTNAVAVLRSVIENQINRLPKEKASEIKLDIKVE